jgi:hypothetical protein
MSPAQFKVSKRVRVRPKQRKADDLGSLRCRSEDRASRPSLAAKFIKYLNFLMQFQAFPALEQPLLAKLARIDIGRAVVRSRNIFTGCHKGALTSDIAMDNIKHHEDDARY